MIGTEKETAMNSYGDHGNRKENSVIRKTATPTSAKHELSLTSGLFPKLQWLVGENMQELVHSIALSTYCTFCVGLDMW